MATAWKSFDAQTGAAAVTGGAPELPPNLQRHGVLWPTPADQVSNHAAEGAPWVPAAGTINQPDVPLLGPEWAADHDGPSIPATSPLNQAAPASGIHDGTQQPQLYPGGRANIGQPFTVQVARFFRTLATAQWAPNGMRVNPPDAPSAPVQIYGSLHDTTPRMIGYELPPLFDWAWASGESFSQNPGYLGVNAEVPDMAPRPQGAVTAGQPSQPYVAPPPAAAPAAIDYNLGY